MRRPSWITCGCAFLLAAVFLLTGCQEISIPNASTGDAPASIIGTIGESASVPDGTSLPSEPQLVERRIRFSAVGDNLIHNSIYESAAQKAGGNGYDFTYAYANVLDFLSGYDVNWINQETLVNDVLPASTYPCFSTPGELGHAAYNAGWRVFALSNNHTYDKGASGISATMRYWESMPEDVVTYGLFTGTVDDSGIALQEINGLTIAYVAFTENTNGISTPPNTEAFVIYTSEHSAMEHKVKRAREMADVVVASVHWGVEDSHTVVPGQRSLGQNLADWGADVIIGTHPHVVQEIEWLSSQDGRAVLIAYSLGNFLSAQSKPDQLIGLALTFELSMTEQPDGTMQPLSIENVQAYPTVTQYEYDGGSRYIDPRTYLYRDYSDDLAAQHRVRKVEPSFSRAYIQEVCQKYVSEEFLVLY